jgi:hypothetical protein
MEKGGDLIAGFWRSQCWMAEISKPYDEVFNYGVWRYLTQDTGDLSAVGWRYQVCLMEISYWSLHEDIFKRTIEISTMEGKDPNRNIELEIHSLRAVLFGGILSLR